MRFSTAATTFLALSSPASAQLSVLTGVVTILNDFNKLVNDTITFNIFGLATDTLAITSDIATFALQVPSLATTDATTLVNSTITQICPLINQTVKVPSAASGILGFVSGILKNTLLQPLKKALTPLISTVPAACTALKCLSPSFTCSASPTTMATSAATSSSSTATTTGAVTTTATTTSATPTVT